jgi:hypothetical protein
MRWVKVAGLGNMSKQDRLPPRSIVSKSVVVVLRLKQMDRLQHRPSQVHADGRLRVKLCEGLNEPLR